MTDVQLSKFLSLVLRHEPEKIGLQLDAAGWARVDELLSGLQQHHIVISRARLEEIVARNDKQRLAFDESGERIRASQGHSVPVEFGYSPQTPPEKLFHGTVARFLDSIRTRGLLKGERSHVHLSAEATTASKVGQRRGLPFILEIDSHAMHRSGHRFFRSANGVWLVDHVPANFISFPDR